MAKRYVDCEQLEKLFAEYAVPYTNIFDELKQYDAEEIARQIPGDRLKRLVDEADDVFATQIWTKEDIHAAMRKLGIRPEGVSEEEMEKIIREARPQLENCSDNWDRLIDAIEDIVAHG